MTPPTVNNLQEEDDQPIVEVDPTEGGLKQEGWMMGSGGDDSTDYEIPCEQFEQDMQAEDEQYIQAGNDALSGQQVDNPLLLLLIREIELDSGILHSTVVVLNSKYSVQPSLVLRP